MYDYFHYMLDGWINYKEFNGTQEQHVLAQLILRAMN